MGLSALDVQNLITQIKTICEHCEPKAVKAISKFSSHIFIKFLFPRGTPERDNFDWHQFDKVRKVAVKLIVQAHILMAYKAAIKFSQTAFYYNVLRASDQVEFLTSVSSFNYFTKAFSCRLKEACTNETWYI